MEMLKVGMFKMPFKTKHFNKNQTVWIQYTTGNMAVFVTGKFRGKNRYISSWVKYEKAEKDKTLMPKLKIIEVSGKFAKKHNLKIYPDELKQEPMPHMYQFKSIKSKLETILNYYEKK